MVSSIKTLDQAEQELKNLPRFRGKNLNLYSTVSFYDDGRIYLKVQDPDTPAHIDDYMYNLRGAGGRWDFEHPYKLDKADYPLSNGLFPLDSFSFATAAKITQTYNAKAAGAGSNQTLKMIEYDHYFAGRGSWKYEEKIDGGSARENVEYKILFNNDGSIKYFGEPNGWSLLNDSIELSFADKTLKDLLQLKGKKIFIRKALLFTSNIIYATLQRPDSLKRSVSYEYTVGQVWEKQPEEFDADYGDPTKVWPLDSISFNQVSKIANAYTAKARAVESNSIGLSEVKFDIDPPVWAFDPVIKAVDGTAYRISISKNGSLKSFSKQ